MGGGFFRWTQAHFKKQPEPILRLEQLLVVYPGSRPYALSGRIRAVPLRDALTTKP
ncbi:MAG: hypothetical protein JJT96_01840 [Opitutales bacterium]|nr:hypothetical protein [Opitutales bacterium]